MSEVVVCSTQVEEGSQYESPSGEEESALLVILEVPAKGKKEIR